MGWALYWKKNLAINNIIKKDGNTTPNVATRAPGIPLTLYPT